jgi:hypothetical protein
MYRFGDGTAFPLEENFIDTLIQAVETCTYAFSPLAELDLRREKAVLAERDGQQEVDRLLELDRVVETSLAQFMPSSAAPTLSQATALKIVAATKQSVIAVRSQIEARARGLLAEAEPRHVADRVQAALAPFFERAELPGTSWVLAWDARGANPRAEATATSGSLSAIFTLDVAGIWQQPIRNEQFATDAVVHLVRKRTFGKAKPTPLDLSKMLMVGIEHTSREVVLSIRENLKSQAGFRFLIGEEGVTFSNINSNGELEPEILTVGDDDLSNLRRLAQGAVTQLAALRARRTVRELRFGNEPLVQSAEPKEFPFELLMQLTPLCRALRDRSTIPGELALKRDIGDGRREELFVPRAALAARFASLPISYRRPFEEMGLGHDDASSNGVAAGHGPRGSAPISQKIMG